MKPEDKTRSKETYDFLNKVGCGFCLAKWTQVTIHLSSGITHSCHHVGAHKIPLDELAKDPGALHNTSEKKLRRKEMLAGKRPTECDYCWRIEDNTNEYSDRILKSASSWSQVDKDKIKKSTGDENFYPRAVEISFSNVCNFKCSYCGPPFSSKWAEEIKQQVKYSKMRIYDFWARNEDFTTEQIARSLDIEAEYINNLKNDEKHNIRLNFYKSAINYRRKTQPLE